MVSSKSHHLKSFPTLFQQDNCNFHRFHQFWCLQKESEPMTTDQVIFASKNQHKAQISSKLRQKFEQFEVLFTGFSGL